MAQIKVEYNIDGIEGLCVITPKVHMDNRGYFMEIFNENDIKEVGLDFRFVQDNQSGSMKGVLRGLHYQNKYPQAKLVRVIKGVVYDVAVDLRPGSPTFGKYHGELLTDQNNRQFLIPRGFAHRFLVLTNFAEFHYKCDDFYHPNDEGGIAWNDPTIGIAWEDVVGEYPGSADPSGYQLSDGTPLLLSERDRSLPGLDAFLKK